MSGSLARRRPRSDRPPGRPTSSRPPAADRAVPTGRVCSSGALASAYSVRALVDLALGRRRWPRPGSVPCRRRHRFMADLRIASAYSGVRPDRSGPAWSGSTSSSWSGHGGLQHLAGQRRLPRTGDSGGRGCAQAWAWWAGTSPPCASGPGPSDVCMYFDELPGARPGPRESTRVGHEEGAAADRAPGPAPRCRGTGRPRARVAQVEVGRVDAAGVDAAGVAADRNGLDGGGGGRGLDASSTSSAGPAARNWSMLPGVSGIACGQAARRPSP